MKKIIRATHQGQIDLMGTKISCAVLEDGTRILVDRSVADALGKKGSGTYWKLKKKGATNLPEYISAAYLKPYISEELTKKLENPINYINTMGNEAMGIDATLLPQICDVWISARNSGGLTQQQEVTAEKAYILMKAFATIGITALIDEATGYQYDRERYELQKILTAYVSDEILKWQLTFTDEFYKEIFRLWNLPFIPKYIKNKPSFIGKLTTKYIYDQMPKGVMEKIRENIGKTAGGNYRYRWHQGLTPEIGKEHLKKQIHEVTALMSISESKEHFNALFQKKYGTEPIQLELEFNEDLEKTKSKFEKSIEKAINYNPI